MEERGRGGRGSNRRLALFTVLFGVCALCAISKGRKDLDMMTFPGSSAGKGSTHNVGDLGLIPGSGRSPGGGHGNPVQYSCPENPHGRSSLEDYCPWGHKEPDMTERLSTAHSIL